MPTEIRARQNESLLPAMIGDIEEATASQLTQQAGDRCPGRADGAGELRVGDPDIHQGIVSPWRAERFAEQCEETEQTLIERWPRLHRGPGFHLPQAGGDTCGKIRLSRGRVPGLDDHCHRGLRTKPKTATIGAVSDQEAAWPQQSQENLGAIPMHYGLSQDSRFDGEDILAVERDQCSADEHVPSRGGQTRCVRECVRHFGAVRC